MPTKKSNTITEAAKGLSYQATKATILTKQGRIKKRFQPSIYFDSSVLIDYWDAEGMEGDIPDELRNREEPWTSAMREALKSDLRLSKVAKIRRKLASEVPNAFCVISPLAIIELTEWFAEAKFKNIAAEASGVLAIQRKGKKEIGRLLSALLERTRTEIENNRKVGRQGPSTGWEILRSETLLDRYYTKHGFYGLLQVELVNFGLDIPQTFNLPYLFAYMQMGLADILHILAARHLGVRISQVLMKILTEVGSISKTEQT